MWTTQDYMYMTAECVIGVLSVLGNGLVLIAIYKIRSLRTVTNCFIGSLALADTLVGFVVPPTVILPYLGLPKNFYGCVFINSVVVLITNISILNMLIVALERYLAISDPFRYERVMTVKRAMAVVVVAWVIAILIGLIPIMGWNLGSEGFKRCSFTAVIDIQYAVYIIFFGFFIPPFLFMFIIYTYIFHIMRKKRQNTVTQLPMLSGKKRRNVRWQKKEVRGAKGLAYVIILFAVCWMPIHIMNCITLFAPEKSGPYTLLLVAIVLSHANSVFNPFLYAFSYSQFKRAMEHILCCASLHHSHASIFSTRSSLITAVGIKQKCLMSNENTFNANMCTTTLCGDTPIAITVENLSNIASEDDKNYQLQEVTDNKKKALGMKIKPSSALSVSLLLQRKAFR